MTGELSHVRAVLFDFDDTLVDTYPARVAAMARAFAEAGVTSPSAEEFFQQFNGATFTVPFADIERRHGAALGLTEGYRRSYWLHEADNVPVFPGVRETLDALRMSARPLGLVTSKGREFVVEGARAGALYQLERTGLFGYFDTVVGAEDVDRHKPDPEAVLTALERLGVTPDDALMVGDSTADFGAGRAAGCWVCHAAWGGRPTGPPIHGAEPHHVADTPADVLRLLGVG